MAYPFCEEAFVSGLLHDVGKLLMWKNFPEEYAEILADVQQGSELLAAEDKTLGFTHAEAGVCLIEHWQMESFIFDAFLYHYESPGRVSNALPMVKIVCAANSLFSDCYDDAARLKIAADMFGLSLAETEDLIEQADFKVKHVAQSLGITIEDIKDKKAVYKSDMKAQGELVQRVRDMSLLQGMLQNLLNARDINAILNVAHQGLQILFDIKKILFFLYHEPENLLVGTAIDSSSMDSVISELSVPVQENKRIHYRRAE